MGARVPFQRLAIARPMSPHDTDPQRSPSFAGSADTTEPGQPPEASGSGSGTAPADARLAAALLADLAKAPLPTEGVRETEGHAAAAMVLGPHRPPRATESPTSEPAVMLNTTEPLPRPPVVIAVRPAAPQNTTVPRARAQQRKPVGAIAAVLVIATVVGASILAFGRSGAVPAVVGAPSAIAASSPAAAAVTAPVSVASPVPVPPVVHASTPSPSAAPPVVTTATAVTPAPRPSAPPAMAHASAPPAMAHASAPTHNANPPPAPPAPSPRPPRSPSGTFEEPDRTF